MDLTLTTEEHQHVTRTLFAEFVDRVDHRTHLIAAVTRTILVVVAVGSVAQLDRVRATLDHEDRCGVAIRPAEVFGEPFGVDRRRGDDHLQIGALRQQLLEVAEREIDVEAALVRLVDDQGVVSAQHAIALELVEQDPIGHHPQQRALADTVVEANRVPHPVADRRADLLGDPLGHRASRHPPGLRVPDQSLDPAARLEAHLRELGALARPGLARHDHDLVVADRLDQLVTAFGDRQRLRVADRPGRRQPFERRLACSLLTHTALTLITRIRTALGGGHDGSRVACSIGVPCMISIWRSVRRAGRPLGTAHSQLPGRGTLWRWMPICAAVSSPPHQPNSVASRMSSANGSWCTANG